MRQVPIPLTLLAAPAVAQHLSQGAAPSVAVAVAVAVAPKQTGADPSCQNFAAAVRRGWGIDRASVAARVVLTRDFEMTPAGCRVADRFHRVGAATGPEAGIEVSCQSARRAVLRCGTIGLDLPPDRHDHWKAVEITFDPTMMVTK